MLSKIKLVKINHCNLYILLHTHSSNYNNFFMNADSRVKGDTFIENSLGWQSVSLEVF